MGTILPTVGEITPIIKKCIILESNWKCANGLLSNVEDVAKLQYVKKNNFCLIFIDFYQGHYFPFYFLTIIYCERIDILW